MQTFLPEPGYMRSAKALDNKRLGKQRVECKQILRALGVQVGFASEATGWRHHPAVQMWRGHEYSLCRYAMHVCMEWLDRGFTDRLLAQFCSAASELYNAGRSARPPFVTDPAFNLSHRSNLIRKDPAFYGPKWPGTPANLPYVWPGP